MLAEGLSHIKSQVAKGMGVWFESNHSSLTEATSEATQLNHSMLISCWRQCVDDNRRGG